MMSPAFATPPAIDVVLPCLDEAGALPWVLNRIPPGFRAIVVDNGSRDGSATIAAGFGATVVTADPRGFGMACQVGLETATSELVCFMDADASLDPADLPDVVAPVSAGQADLALGRRRPTTPRAWPPHARIGNAIVTRELRRRTGVPIRDLGVMRAAHRQALLDMQLQDRRFGYPLEMVAVAASGGWRILEVDVAYHPRVGRSKVTGTVRGTFQTIRDMQRVLRVV